MTNHTPWAVTTLSGMTHITEEGSYVPVISLDKRMLAKQMDAIKRAVHCVNVHDELVEALETAVDYLNKRGHSLTSNDFNDDLQLMKNALISAKAKAVQS